MRPDIFTLFVGAIAWGADAFVLFRTNPNWAVGCAMLSCACFCFARWAAR